MPTFGEWLEKKYLDWQANIGRRASLREFGEAIGIDQKTLANWLRGAHKPNPDYADRISIFLNYDLTVYDLLGLPRPAKELLQLKALWPDMNERDRTNVAKLLDKIEKSHATQKRQPLPNA